MTLKNHADVHCYCALEYPLKKHFSHAFQNQCCKTFLKKPIKYGKNPILRRYMICHYYLGPTMKPILLQALACYVSR